MEPVNGRGSTTGAGCLQAGAHDGWALQSSGLRIDNELIMNLQVATRPAAIILAIISLLALASMGFAQATAIPASQLINPDELARIVQSSKDAKPLIIQVGSRVLFEQAHIPGSEYIGPASTASGLQHLRDRLKPLPRNQFIVIFCGCCPWSHCPNVKPASDALHDMGFTRFKVLYIANNFGADWVDKGYPVAKGD